MCASVPGWHVVTDDVSWSRVTSTRPRPRRQAGDQAARTVLDTEHGDNPYYVDQGFFNTLTPLHGADVGYEGEIGVNTSARLNTSSCCFNFTSVWEIWR